MNSIYKITNPKPTTQFLHIEATLPSPNNTLDVQLPAWRPGRYELGNFAKNIGSIKAYAPDGTPLPISKTTKDSWQVLCPNIDTVTLRYTYYANTLNAGSTFADNRQVYVNPVNCLVYTIGAEHLPCTVELPTTANALLACGLPYTTETNGAAKTFTLTAKNYDELADSPFILSTHLKHFGFNEARVNFTLWFMGECKPEEELITQHFKAFAAEQLATMVGFPVNDYHFLFQILPTPFHHGVEHTTTTVIALGPGYKLMHGANYDDFLGVSSHELFHVWNVKSIRPAEMQPYDFTKENYFTTGYVAEGVTTYYGDLFLARAKVFDSTKYLNILSDNVTRYTHNFGNRNYSVAQSGFDMWLDGYTQGIPHRKVSIYNEGALCAFMTDVLIRTATKNEKSLDDVMRSLYTHFGLQGKGYTDMDYIATVEQTAGIPMADFFASYVYGTQDYIPLLDQCFDYLGLQRTEKLNPNPTERMFGFKVDAQNKVTITAPNSPAETALTIGDTLVAVNGFAITNNLTDWVNYFGCESMRFTINQSGILSNVLLQPAPQALYPISALAINPNASAGQQENYRMWIKSNYQPK